MYMTDTLTGQTFCLGDHVYRAFPKQLHFIETCNNVTLLPCRFSCIVQYVERSLGKVPADFDKVLAAAPCSTHILQMDLTTDLTCTGKSHHALPEAAARPAEAASKSAVVPLVSAGMSV